MNRWLKRGWGVSDPLRVIRLPFFENSDDLLKFRLNEKNNNISSKGTNNVYLPIKQKKYVIRKNFQLKKN